MARVINPETVHTTVSFPSTTIRPLNPSPAWIYAAMTAELRAFFVFSDWAGPFYGSHVRKSSTFLCFCNFAFFFLQFLAYDNWNVVKFLDFCISVFCNLQLGGALIRWPRGEVATFLYFCIFMCLYFCIAVFLYLYYFVFCDWAGPY